jgi:hypothetical protein
MFFTITIWNTTCKLLLRNVSLSSIFTQIYILLLAVPTREGGSRYKLQGPGGPEGGPGPDYVAYVYVFLSSIILCRLYKLTLSDQVQVIVQLRVSLSDLV